MLTIKTIFGIKLIPMSLYEDFGFNWKSYASDSQGTRTVCKKTNIFYHVNDGAVEALLL